MIRKFYLWLRFGTITCKVVDTINGLPCEKAYYGRRGKLIGYWAYGNFDPEAPYQGQ